MDYHHLPEVAFHNEIRRTILPFGIIPGIIFEIGACIYTWFTTKATYREMKLVSCYSNRLVSTDAEAFEIILHNKYLKRRSLLSRTFLRADDRAATQHHSA